MQLLLALVFLGLALSTGAHVYTTKNTLSHWLVSGFSAFASVISSWTVLYYAARFFYNPSKIVIDTFFLNIALVFNNHPATDPVVFGNTWILACTLPMFAMLFMVRELRKVPQLQPSVQDEAIRHESAIHIEAHPS